MFCKKNIIFNFVNRKTGKPENRLMREGFTPIEKHKAGLTRAITIPGQTSLTGFTLIELMLVVVIIAALASMVVPRLAGRSEQAKISRAQADISSNISLALKLYELDNGNYPTTEQGLDALMSKSSGNPIPENWNGPYLEKKPIDSWGRAYHYRYPGAYSAAGYDLYSLGKDGQESDDDVTNWEE